MAGLLNFCLLLILLFYIPIIYIVFLYKDRVTTIYRTMASQWDNVVTLAIDSSFLEKGQRLQQRVSIMLIFLKVDVDNILVNATSLPEATVQVHV